MTTANQDSTEKGLAHVVAAAQYRPLTRSVTFDEWLQRWKDNSDEVMAKGLLHSLFELEPSYEVDPRRVIFLINLLAPLGRYSDDEESWRRVQEKAAAVFVSNLFKKREHGAYSLGLRILSNNPELLTSFLSVLSACRNGFARPEFFAYDERDSLERLIQDFLRECGRVFRGYQFDNREKASFLKLHEEFLKNRKALFLLFLEHRLDQLCLPSEDRAGRFDDLKDVDLDLAALRAIVLSRESFGEQFDSIDAALASYDTGHSIRRAAAIQWALLDAILTAKRRALRKAKRRTH